MEGIFPPILQWIILQTPGCVHNPLCDSDFKRDLLNHTSDHLPGAPELGVLSSGTRQLLENAHHLHYSLLKEG